MVPRSTPDSRIHTSSVEPDSASGSPEEKPSSKTISTRRCRYTASPSRPEEKPKNKTHPPPPLQIHRQPLAPGGAGSGENLGWSGRSFRCGHKKVLADSDGADDTIIAGNDTVIARLDRGTQYSRVGRWEHAASTFTYLPIASAAHFTSA